MAKSALDQVFEQLGKFTQGFGRPNGGKPISPLAESQTLDAPGKLNYANNNVHMEQQARQNPGPTIINKKLEYPEWMSNAASPGAMNAIKKARELNPSLQMSDADIANYYNQYGENLLPGLNVGKAVQTTPTPKPNNPQFGNVNPAQAQEPTNNVPVFKFQNEVNQISKQYGLSPNDFHLLRAGENKAENPEAINDNWNKDHTKIVSRDVGLYQISVPLYDSNGNPNPNAETEIQRLKDPLYNTQKAAEIWTSRLKLLEDPVLTIASYNLGAGGAVLRPLDALKRAQWVYYNAGIPVPQTDFAKDPVGYVNQRMDTYKQLGLFK